jgi:hypothetical protein
MATKGDARITTRGPGVEGWRNHLTAMSRVVQSASKAQLAGIAESLVREARARAPFKTGNLEAAITMKTTGRGWQHDVGIDEVAAPYAVYMHEGMFDVAGGEGDDGEGGGKRTRASDLMPYELGPGSEAKNIGTPHIGKGVGIRFMPRAWEYVYRLFIHAAPSLKRDVVNKVLSRIGEVGRQRNYRAGLIEEEMPDVKRATKAKLS